MKFGLRKLLLNFLKSTIGDDYTRSIDLERFAVMQGFSGSYAKRELKKMEKDELLECYHSETAKRYANFRIKRQPVLSPVKVNDNTVMLVNTDSSANTAVNSDKETGGYSELV